VTTSPSTDSAFGSGDTRLVPLYTFEEFVVGTHNRFPHAASLAVSENLGKAYNPLFIYGPVGIGKTHLMQSVGHRVLQRDPNTRVLYVTAQQFMTEVIELLQAGRLQTLRDRYRALDLLLVDDIQFLATSEATQEEFFHTFNDLHASGKQIIMTSDRPPKMLTTLEDRLRSRFEWGLIADIKFTNLETRVAILKKKESRLTGLHLADDIRLYIASRLKSNIRELEGFLRRIQAYSQLYTEEITLELVKDILKELLPPEEWVTEGEGGDRPADASLMKELGPEEKRILSEMEGFDLQPSHSENNHQPKASPPSPTRPPLTRESGTDLSKPSPAISDEIKKPDLPTPPPKIPLVSPTNEPVVSNKTGEEPKGIPQGNSEPQIREEPKDKDESKPPRSLDPGKPPAGPQPPTHFPTPTPKHVSPPPGPPPPLSGKRPHPMPSFLPKAPLGENTAFPQPPSPLPAISLPPITPPKANPSQTIPVPGNPGQIPVVFFFPVGRVKELVQMKKKFEDIINKHKLKFVLHPALEVEYAPTAEMDTATFLTKCQQAGVSIGIVLGPAPDAALQEGIFFSRLQEAFDQEKLSLQMVPWDELSKDYRFLNLALDITLIRIKQKK
jgi:Holliday junction resolvasome RuvABC ATP-dependent DNA helicase subunit